MPGHAGARALDAADELAPLRREFELPRERGRTLIYLCGHSLGLMPRAARRSRRAQSSTAGRGSASTVIFPTRGRRGAAPRPLRAAHGGWLDYHAQFAPLLADLVGA